MTKAKFVLKKKEYKVKWIEDYNKGYAQGKKDGIKEEDCINWNRGCCKHRIESDNGFFHCPIPCNKRERIMNNMKLYAKQKQIEFAEEVLKDLRNCLEFTIEPEHFNRLIKKYEQELKEASE